jgi:hypothetical protein
LPAAVPWSLRRELAQQGEQPSSSKLKSYGKTQTASTRYICNIANHPCRV